MVLIVWRLLVVGYGASIVPLFRQAFRPVPRHPVASLGNRMVVCHPNLTRTRHAGRSAA